MSSSSSSALQPKELYEFLVEAELDQYYTQFTSCLKVLTVAQIKYVEDEDLGDLGMTRPEIRRLRRYFKKENEPGALAKFKKMLIKGQEDLSSSCTTSNKSPQSSSSSSSKAPPLSSSSSVRGGGGAAVERCVISEDDVSIHRELGRGEFSTVHHAVWKKDGAKVQVAVKIIKRNSVRRDTSDFHRDVVMMTLLEHKHLALIYGLIFTEDTLILVMELAPQRSLLDCLRDPVIKTNFSVATLCDLALQISEAMQYLESRNYIHRNLCARNVLVFSRDFVKVSDAGLTASMGIDIEYYHQSSISASLKLAVAWCAPECCMSDRRKYFSSASDVWSYAVTLWEMFSYGFQPWAGFTAAEIISAISMTSMSVHNGDMAISGEGSGGGVGGQSLDQPDRCPRDFYELMTRCWQYDPSKRPLFAHITDSLQSMKAHRVQVHKDSSVVVVRGDCLLCKVGDIITVLDKRPQNTPVVEWWKGVQESTGRVGFFDPTTAANYIDLKSSHLSHKNKHKDSDNKKSSKSGGGGGGASHPRLHAGMISAPQADLRHTGHVGYDGSTFGDVAFIGKNYDRLPVKVHTPQRSAEDVRGSVKSLPTNDVVASVTVSQSRLSSSSSDVLSPTDPINHRSVVNGSASAKKSNSSLRDFLPTPLTATSGCQSNVTSSSTSQSNISLLSDCVSSIYISQSSINATTPRDQHANVMVASRSNASICSDAVSRVTSVISSDTLTDVSSMQTDLESRPMSCAGDVELDTDDNDYDAVHDNGFDDFKIPDLSTSLDLGPSLIDEVMKVLDCSNGSTSVVASNKITTSIKSTTAPLATKVTTSAITTAPLVAIGMNSAVSLSTTATLITPTPPLFTKKMNGAKLPPRDPPPPTPTPQIKASPPVLVARSAEDDHMDVLRHDLTSQQHAAPSSCDRICGTKAGDFLDKTLTDDLSDNNMYQCGDTLSSSVDAFAVDDTPPSAKSCVWEYRGSVSVIADSSRAKNTADQVLPSSGQSSRAGPVEEYTTVIPRNVSSAGGRVFSKLSSSSSSTAALGKRNSTSHIQDSHHLQPNNNQQNSPASSSSSSAEFLAVAGAPGSSSSALGVAGRFSSSSSGSLPGRNLPSSGRPQTSSGSAGVVELRSHHSPRPTSVVDDVGGEEGGEGDTTSPLRWLRDGHAFSRTKARIRNSMSAVSSALSVGGGGGGRGGGKGTTPPVNNLNINLPFFDRLREQEQERLEAEQNEERLRLLNSVEERGSLSGSCFSSGNAMLHRNTDINSPGNVILPSSSTMSGTTGADSACVMTCSDSGPLSSSTAGGVDRCRSVESHDSDHSSITHQSDEGVFTDDSGSASLEGSGHGLVDDRGVMPEGYVDNTGIASPAAILSPTDERSLKYIPVSSSSSSSSLRPSRDSCSVVVDSPTKTTSKFCTASKTDNALDAVVDTYRQCNGASWIGDGMTDEVGRKQRDAEDYRSRYNSRPVGRDFMGGCSACDDRISYEDIMENALNESFVPLSSSSATAMTIDEKNFQCDKLQRHITSVEKMTFEESRSPQTRPVKDVSEISSQTFKVNQLFAQTAGAKGVTRERCEEVLEICKWDVAAAARYIVANPPDQESPEFVNV